MNPVRIAERPHGFFAQQLALQLVLVRRGPIEPHSDLPRRIVVPRDHACVERRPIAAQPGAAGLADHLQGGAVRARAHDESTGGHHGDALGIRAAEQHLSNLPIDRIGRVAPRVDGVLKVLRLFPHTVAIAALRRDLHPNTTMLRAFGKMQEIHDASIGRERRGAVGDARFGEHRALTTTRVAQRRLPLRYGSGLRLNGPRLGLHHRQRVSLEGDLRLRIRRCRGLEQRRQRALRVQHAQQRPQMLAGAMLLPVRARAAEMQSPRARAQEHSIRASALHCGGGHNGINVLEGEHGGIDVRFPAFAYIRRKALLKQDGNHDQRSLTMTPPTAAT